MKTKELWMVGGDGLSILVYEWFPDEIERIKAVVQIAHGMAEHGGRYADFAQFLTDHDFAVYAIDHRGHGKTAGSLDRVGYLGPDHGWENLVADFGMLSKYVLEHHPGKSLFVLGHSMGSFAVRRFILDPTVQLAGAIISGTGDDPGLLGQVGVLLTRVIQVFYPATSPSPFMDQLSFGAFNQPFKPNRTKFDWLSRDSEQVDQYVADPYCGGIFSIGFFRDMLKGLLYVSKQKNINRIRQSLPVLIFSGGADPVGGNGKGVRAVYEKFGKAGVKDLTFKLFPEGRHEMLNEINKSEVYQFVLDWMQKRIND